MEFPACKQINKQSNREKTMKQIEVRGDRVHNLKNIDVNMPLNKIVGIAGASSSGKSSLALGVLYAEGSRRYLESLSTYTRRRMTGTPSIGKGARWVSTLLPSVRICYSVQQTGNLHKSAYRIIRCNCIDKNCYTYKYDSIFLCPFIITILCICQKG